MNSNTKSEKVKSILSHRKLQKISDLIQFMEICVFLVFVASQVPAAFKNSGAFFRDISMTLASPRSVFFIGNAIVIVLFAMSGHFGARDSSVKGSSDNLYDEFVDRSEKSCHSRRFEIQYEEKQGRTEESRIVKNTVACDARNYKRTHSLNLNMDRGEKSVPMRRSVTEKCLKAAENRSGEEEKKMSKEEFRSKIEAFIERQQRMRRGETECSVF